MPRKSYYYSLGPGGPVRGPLRPRERPAMLPGHSHVPPPPPTGSHVKSEFHLPLLMAEVTGYHPLFPHSLGTGPEARTTLSTSPSPVKVPMFIASRAVEHTLSAGRWARGWGPNVARPDVIPRGDEMLLSTGLGT